MMYHFISRFIKRVTQTIPVLSTMAQTDFMLGILVIFVVLLTNVSYGQSENDESGEEIRERQEYLYMRRAGGPEKMLPQGAYEAAFRQSLLIQKDRNLLNSPTALTNWVSVNPTGMFYNRTGANYISGRANWYAFDPTDTNTFYLASAGGGIWKTVDGGTHFVTVTDNLSALTSGAVAIDPNNHNIVYVATGELNYSGDSYYGNGIFKSTDGGTSWVSVATTSVGSSFSAIIVDPSNSNTVYASGSKGVYKTTNAGGTWSYTNSTTYANTLVMDPSNTQILYTSAGSNLIRKTTNGGGAWTTLTNGLPSSNNGRIMLAISASNPSVLYASIARADNSGLLGLYRTSDAGDSWTLQNSTTNYLGSQGWYDNVVAVHPTNPDFVAVGGIDIYTSSDAGATLTQRSSWSTTSASNMAHADIHFLGWKGPILYCASDGGAYRSTNNGVVWSDMNQTISTLQYQSADYDPTNLQKMYGGNQDNDKQTTTDGGLTWIQRTTGDGGYTIVDPVTPNYVYGAYVYGSIKRSSNSGVSFTEISPSGSVGGLFYNPYEIAPGDHNTIVYAQADVWKTTSAHTATSVSGWTRIGDSLTINGNVSAIGISSSTTNKIYIGTSNGKILVTTDNGSTWSSTAGLPYVSDLVVDPTNDAVAYASFGGFTATKHIYKTTNSGILWTNVTGNLPNIPCISIILTITTPRTIFVGTDLGVYKSTDDGTTWVSFNNGMPAVEIFDLKYHASASTILAATHGRGCFTYALPLATHTITATAGSHGSITPSGAVSVNDATNKTFTIAPQTGYHIDSVLVDGIKVDSTTSYTFTNVISDHTIDAKFAINTFAITSSASAGGSISPSGGIIVNYGSNQSFTISPNTGYHVDTVTVDGVKMDSTTSYTFTNVTGNHTIHAHFAINTYTITSSASGSGTISPSGGITVNYGASKVYTFLLKNGSHIDSVTVDGVKVDSTTGYTFYNVSANHSIHVTFSITTASVVVDISSRWNLISLPVLIDDSRPVSLFPGAISQAYGYTQQSSYFIAESLRHTAGYWLKFPDEPVPYTLMGGLCFSESAKVEAGWNMVGSISNAIPTSLITSNPSGIMTSDFFGYKGGYFSSDTITPGFGYWVKANQAGTLYLSSIPGSATMLSSSRIRIVSTSDTPPPPPSEERLNSKELPTQYVLDDAYPNPFNPTTEIRYQIPETKWVTLKVFDGLGREVATLVNEIKDPGEYQVQWDASPMPSGLYYYRMQAGTFAETKKLMLVK